MTLTGKMLIGQPLINFPDALLPGALQHGNPLLLWRLLDGQREA